MTLVEILKNLILRIKNSDVGSRIASGAFWSFTGTAIGKFIVLVAGIICARILGKDAYGQFGMVRSTINMFVVFGSAGLGLTATKYISEYLRPSPERIPSIYILTNGFAFITGIIVTIVVLLLAPFLADKTLHCPELTSSIRIGAFLLFVTVLNGAQNGVLSGFEDFKDIAKNTFIAGIAESVFMLLGAHFGGVFGAVLGYGMGFFALYITNFFAIKSKFRQYNLSSSLHSFCKSDLKILYKFSLPAALASLMVAPTFWIVRTILVRNCGFGELAIYEASEQWRTIMLFVPAAVSQVVLPILSSLVNQDSNRFLKILNINILLNGGIALAIAAVVSIFSGYIIKWYGQGFDDGFPLIVLAFSTVFTAVANVAGMANTSRGKVWIGFLFNTIWAMLFIIFSVIFIKQGLGATGIALALLISYACHFVYQFLYLKYSVRGKVEAPIHSEQNQVN